MTSGDLAAQNLARTAFLVRAATAIALHLFLPLGFFTPDEFAYDIRGDYLARYWRNEIPVDPSSQYLGEGKVYYYIVAAIYLPFGAIPLAARLVNAWVGSRAVLELFRVTRLLGGSEVAALRAAGFMAFFPSMVLWSSVIVRDVWVQWLLVRLAREMAELKGRFIAARLVTAGLLVWALTSFRSYLLYAATGPFLLSFVLSRSKDLVRNLVVGAIFALGLSYFGLQGGGSKVQMFDLEEMQRLRAWSSSAVAADSGFARDADISTPGGVLALLPIGLTYFFFAPFPWQIGSTSRMMAIPETIYFYTLVPALLGGIVFLFRRRLAESIGVLMMVMTVTFGYAIGQGNVGTLYRHKAQVIGFYYAFAAIGMESRRRRGATPSYPAYPFNPRDPARTSTPAYDGSAREA